MIKSIRYFLLISLLASITIASAINGVGNYILDEQVIEPYLDAQLVRMSTVISILNQSAMIDIKFETQLLDRLSREQTIFDQKIIFQIWSKTGKLLLRSHNYQNLYLKDVPIGFSNQLIAGEDWRIYSTYDKKQKVKIVIAELYNLRRELVDDIASSNANILLITYPVFGILIWFIISFALQSITRVTSEISNRASTYLEPVQLTEIPIEIKPLVAELNQLFIRLKLAFERNKRFAADAAHELRTPLAALKTNVEVAIKARNDLDKNKALQKVIQSVDRSSHVVAQLLTLSRLGEEENLTDISRIDLHKLATEIIAYLAPQALEKNIDIELTPPPRYSIILGNDTALGVLIRNIVDNAIRYTPDNGEVKVSIMSTIDKIIFRVVDTGPGIPSELRERVFERFYRILGTKTSGSGLGLAIVHQIAHLHHAEIKLSIPSKGIGLQFDVAFPRHRA
ncbi:MAG TPA: ATP-binding protein [Gammaproteobacteria bacterium]|nr:ATP-binding protein [Gammaproteobacteria bacterium]